MRSVLACFSRKEEAEAGGEEEGGLTDEHMCFSWKSIFLS